MRRIVWAVDCGSVFNPDAVQAQIQSGVVFRHQRLPGGIGETGTSAVFPALTNAIFAATGKRGRKLPIRANPST